MSESFPRPTEPEGVIPSLIERFNSRVTQWISTVMWLARQLPERLPAPPSQDVRAVVDRQLPLFERHLKPRTRRQDQKLPRQILSGRQRDVRAVPAGDEAS